ncbi:hypothetical protein SISSUDRAFT_1067773 [Sistotremastrum suecicum HHB10207 ss-3]|uniref:Uncharacterized protein n=1 Tax=Sistotremastrum suecicum HHB10207 ss-3 TaxID=1314776 RepID=A0A165WQB5_9AGAM|nr:hypothetical protein SISSUDRAFT_1067773 [Sistotremastrum suecicum HHB10207 ss-3]
MTLKFPQCRPDRAIGAFDARAAADVDDDHWISTPNMPFVPEPYAITREVRLRADGRSGFDDYTCWPQRYYTQTPHLTCIPRSPMKFSFHVPTEYASCINLIFSDPSLPGSLPSKIRAYETYFAPVLEIIDRHSEVQGLSRGAGWFHLSLERILSRLAHIPMTYRDLIRHVAEFQRYWLELCGLLEYMIRYLPRIRDARNVDHPVCEDLMGVIVTEPNQVQALFSAGIPVRYLRPSYEITAQINVKAVVPEAPYPIIFRGSASDINFVHSRYQFTRSSCSSRPLFDLKATVKRKGDHYEPYPAMQARRPRVMSQDHKLKLVDPISKVMPSTVQTWANALQSLAVRDQPPRCETAGGYSVPQARLFASVEEARLRTYISNWLRLREGWFASLRANDIRGCPLRPQEWRDFLSWKASDEPSAPATSKSQQTRANMQHRMAPFLNIGWTAPKDFGELQFQGRRVFRENGSPDIEVVQLVLWALIHLNFVLEFTAVDDSERRYEIVNDEELAREAVVFTRRSIAIGSIRLITQDDLSATAGLGSALWDAQVKGIEAFDAESNQAGQAPAQDPGDLVNDVADATTQLPDTPWRAGTSQAVQKTPKSQSRVKDLPHGKSGVKVHHAPESPQDMSPVKPERQKRPRPRQTKTEDVQRQRAAAEEGFMGTKSRKKLKIVHEVQEPEADATAGKPAPVPSVRVPSPNPFDVLGAELSDDEDDRRERQLLQQHEWGKDEVHTQAQADCDQDVRDAPDEDAEDKAEDNEDEQQRDKADAKDSEEEEAVGDQQDKHQQEKDEEDTTDEEADEEDEEAADEDAEDEEEHS